MNFEKVVFGFFVLLAATLNFGFVIGDLTDLHQHNVYELYAAVAVNIIATVLKFGGDKTQIGAIHLATSLVASIQLILAAVVFVWAQHVSAEGGHSGRGRQHGLAGHRRVPGQYRLGRDADRRDAELPAPLRSPWSPPGCC